MRIIGHVSYQLIQHVTSLPVTQLLIVCQYHILHHSICHVTTPPQVSICYAIGCNLL